MKIKLAICSVVVLALTLVGCVSEFDDDLVDWSPLIRDKSELVGKWYRGDSILDLKLNGQYSCSGNFCGQLSDYGEWQRVEDFEVKLVSKTHYKFLWRLLRIRKSGKYQFVEKNSTDESADIRQVHSTFYQK